MAGVVIDISSNNPHPINWGAVKASGVSGVIIKATQGTGYRNPFYEQDREGARSAGLDVAAYHFADFGDPTAEAAFFRSVAGDDAKVLDVETSQETAWMSAFRGALPICDMLYGSGSTVARGLFPLTWEASYGGEHPMGSCDLWQFTDTLGVGGIDAPVDASHWMTDDASYAAFFGSTITPAPKTPDYKPLLLLGDDDMPLNHMTPDDRHAWIQERAIAILGHDLDINAVNEWDAYLQFHGKGLTIRHMWSVRGK